jgi:C4-type Zn-finger protein
MTLGNMRENGVRSLAVSCPQCRRQAVVNVDRYDDRIAVPTFGPRMVCTGCGAIGADVRPNWVERPQRESITGEQWRRRAGDA